MTGALGDGSNARPAAYKAAALPAELRGQCESTSAVPKREHPVGCGVSLHVTWQKQFLRDLQQVTELASFDVLIATHSPQIVHDRWDDLTVELQGMATGQPV